MEPDTVPMGFCGGLQPVARRLSVIRSCRALHRGAAALCPTRGVTARGATRALPEWGRLGDGCCELLSAAHQVQLRHGCR